MTITFKDGRKPPYPEDTHPRIKFAQIRTPAPTYPKPPPFIDYITRVADWPMYKNDEAGDCVWAMIGHTIQAITTYGRGKTITVTDADVIKGYSDVTGYNPNDPSSDQGTVIQDALNYWRKSGVGGHKIAAFAQVDHTNPDEVDAALYLFGHIQLGINFPASAMDQFNAGEPWDVVKHTTIEGGHAINLGYVMDEPPQVVGRAPNGNLKVVTWGRVQEMTPAFWDKYVEEAWVVFSEEWLSAAGSSPEGLDVAALGEAFTALTGERFPVQPTPKPQPTPEPVPPGPAPAPPGDADATLAAAARSWLRYRHVGVNGSMARELTAWLAARNL